MLSKFRSRVHRRGELIHNTVENAFITASTLLFTLVTLLVLFFAVFLSRAQ